MPSYEPISLTASATLGDTHIGAALMLNAAAGLTLTLPAASGTGKHFKVVVGTTVTSNDYIIQVASASDTMDGNFFVAADGGSSVVGWEAAADSDTITMNGSTTGGVVGDEITLTDVASGVWAVRGFMSATGTEATPFSAAVS